MLEKGKIDEILFSEQQISLRVRELAREIERDYEGGSPLLVGILKGAFVFMADLVRALEIEVKVDFLAIASYGMSTKTSGIVRILKDIDTDITGLHVIVVEDIIDTGLTLNYVLANLKARNPASLEVCALLNKREANKIDIPVKYEGFPIPDVFVVGYGLDFAEEFRNLPYIASIQPHR
ncbi:MAG: hypoxanthine phosphoribosyltransferase [Actinomycetota bacterium]|nr:hypoxanthine phosphoribosyltransferase [Actinomycetota bacterium]